MAHERPRLRMPCGDERRVTLVVHAPFGADETLSRYPDGLTRSVHDHPFVRELCRVAALGVDVCALVDRCDDDTWLLDIDAGSRPQWSTAWKQDMSSPLPLMRLLIHALRRHPRNAVVLALEGHGAGYLPDIDVARLAAYTPPSSAGQPAAWAIGVGGEGTARPVDAQGRPATGDAVLGQSGEAVMPALMGQSGEAVMPSMAVPSARLPISTWGVGHALRGALDTCRTERIALIHFDNCFNMSLEMLHTVAPGAHFATGYMGYNFFTSARPYPVIFGRLAARGVASAGELARWFAEGNRDELAKKTLPHPTTGSVVALDAMGAVARALDRLAGALIDAMPDVAPGDGAPVGSEPVRDAIGETIRRAAQYDTTKQFELETPDALTDALSWADRLVEADGLRGVVGATRADALRSAAQELADTLAQLQVYGAAGLPWVAKTPDDRWDFRPPADGGPSRLAMNLFLPDPLRAGLWDWRAPYYLTTRTVAHAGGAANVYEALQRHVIDLLTSTRWVEFLDKYHRGVAFAGILAASIPALPTDEPQGTARGDGRLPGWPPKGYDGPKGWEPGTRGRKAAGDTPEQDASGEPKGPAR